MAHSGETPKDLLETPIKAQLPARTLGTEIVSRLERFRNAPRRQQSELTLLISDLVRSTELYERVGNTCAADVLQEQKRIFEETVSEYDAEIVDSRSEEFLVVFESPSASVKFALAVLCKMRAMQSKYPDMLEVRVGISSGEVEVSSDEAKKLAIYGRQVNETGRYCSLSAGGQVICSRHVWDNSQLYRPEGKCEYITHGRFLPQGIKHSVEVCEVWHPDLGEKKKAGPGKGIWQEKDSVYVPLVLDGIWERPKLTRNALLSLLLLVLLAGIVFTGLQLSLWSVRGSAPGGGSLGTDYRLIQRGDIIELLEKGEPPLPTGHFTPLELRVQLFMRARGSAEEFRALEDGATLRSGLDEYYARVDTRSSGYLYVFQLDSSGAIEWLYPGNAVSPTLSGGEAYVSSGKSVRIPEDAAGYFLDETRGLEHVYVVFSVTRWNALEELLATGARTSPSIPTQYATITETMLMRNRNIGGKSGVSGASESPGVEEASSASIRAQGHFMYVARYFVHI